MKEHKTRFEWLVESIAQHNTDECLLWPFQRDGDGYGRLHLPVKEENVRKSVGAHRLAFKLTHGRWPVPCCMHSCDNPPCFNPRHLSEGTNQENQAEKVAKGRHTIGVMQHSAVLTEEEVIAARKEYAEGRIGFGKLAEKYLISRLAMRWAVEGKTWAHIPGAVRALRMGAIRKDFCKFGHLLADDSCYIYGKTRQCKICTKFRSQKRDADIRSRNTDTRTKTKKHSDAAKSYWAGISIENRSLLMKNRAVVRLRNNKIMVHPDD